MSDGMSDAAAEDRLARDVWKYAFDLRTVASQLLKAVQRGLVGHRGWGLARAYVRDEVNKQLAGTGFRLLDEDPERRFHDFGGQAWEPEESWRHKALRRELAKALRVQMKPGQMPSDDELVKACELLMTMYEASQPEQRP